MLTKKQLDLLAFIHTRVQRDGVPPSFDEMKEALDLRSKSGIHRLITALEERGFIRRLAHRARALEILEFVGLRERALEEADGLSYAEEKLLVIARLLATEAEVLLLDEPLSGLDPNTLARVLPIVRRLAAQGRTVCLIEHNLDVIREVCDVAAYLDGGRVLTIGRPDDLMKDPQLLERYIQ